MQITSMSDKNVLHGNNIERIIKNILMNHPIFRTTIDQILRNSNLNVRLSTKEAVAEVGGGFAISGTGL